MGNSGEGPLAAITEGSAGGHSVCPTPIPPNTRTRWENIRQRLSAGPTPSSYFETIPTPHLLKPPAIFQWKEKSPPQGSPEPGGLVHGLGQSGMEDEIPAMMPAERAPAPPTVRLGAQTALPPI